MVAFYGYFGDEKNETQQTIMYIEDCVLCKMARFKPRSHNACVLTIWIYYFTIKAEHGSHTYMPELSQDTKRALACQHDSIQKLLPQQYFSILQIAAFNIFPSVHHSCSLVATLQTLSCVCHMWVPVTSMEIFQLISTLKVPFT